MPNKIEIAFILLLVTPVLMGQQVNVNGSQAETQKGGDTVSMFLGRFGYFLASDSDFKNIYGNGAVFGGELRLGGKRIASWLEANYRWRTGKFSFTGEETKVNVMSLEGGALYRIMSGNIWPYVGAGIGYYMYNEKNVPLGEAKQSKIGFCAAAGVSAIIAKLLVLDFRFKYSVCNMKPADYDINIGGLTIGMGMGVRF
jgi:opacity protein-like surface antigen